MVKKKFIVVRDVMFNEVNFKETRLAINIEEFQDKTDASDLGSKSVVKQQKSDKK